MPDSNPMTWEHVNQAAVFVVAARQELSELSHPDLWRPIQRAAKVAALIDVCGLLDAAVNILHAIRAALPPQDSALGDDLAQASGTDAEPSKEEPKAPSLQGESEGDR